MNPKDPADSAICRLTIALTNVAMDSIARTTIQEQPSLVRDRDLKLALKAAVTVAELIKVRDARQTLYLQSVNVGQVNIQSGGRAIIGNVNQPKPDEERLRTRLRCRTMTNKPRRGTSPHKRNTGPMLNSRRCGARTRQGTPCRAPAVSGQKRCRMHGGARGSGAPKNNKNALKHGAYTRSSQQQRAAVRALLAEAQKLLQEGE